VAQKKKLAFQISYVTITYRSVFFAILALFALFVIVMYFAFPETGNRWLQASEVSLGKVLAKIGLGSGAKGPVGIDPGPQQAHFTNIDGTVRVKKVSTNKWITADYNVALEKGDVVQTASEGIAKIVLTDGTNYTVKPDSLIVVQENSVNSAQQTSVAVQVTTGTVDLATSTVSQGSKSQVTVAGATATLASDTTAQATNDMGHDNHEILLKKGSGEVNRNGETVKLANYEKVTFKNDSPNLIKTKEIGPPVLIDPPNMQPVFVGSTGKPVDFSWTPVDGAKHYRITVSKNPYFSSVLLSQIVDTAQIKLNGLKEGSYYWEVQSVGENGKESVASDKNRFTVIPKGADNVNITLELEPLIQHGHVIEIRGKTEPNARVMVNGQEVAVIGSDGKFYHFTNPLPTGMSVITITAQNRKGGVNTKTQPVVIQ
jgi:hypothetical protein